MRIAKSRNWIVPFCMVMLFLAVEVVTGSFIALLPAEAQVQRSNLTITVQPTNDGWWTRYRFFAAEEWHPGADVPSRVDSAAELKWKIIAEYPDGKHQFLYYWTGKYRQASGNPQAVPARWAYLRLKEDKWDGQKWMLPDGTAVMPSKIPLDGTVLQLMQEYSKKQIMDSMDKFVGIDGVGAPEK